MNISCVLYIYLIYLFIFFFESYLVVMDNAVLAPLTFKRRVCVLPIVLHDQVVFG